MERWLLHMALRRQLSRSRIWPSACRIQKAAITLEMIVSGVSLNAPEAFELLFRYAQLQNLSDCESSAIQLHCIPTPTTAFPPSPLSHLPSNELRTFHSTFANHNLFLKYPLHTTTCHLYFPYSPPCFEPSNHSHLPFDPHAIPFPHTRTHTHTPLPLLISPLPS